MKELVWVVGNSGVGKETFCRYVVAHPEAAVVKQLGWAGLRVGLSEASIDLVSRGHRRVKRDERDKVIDEILEQHNRIDIVLLKWQGVDSRAHRISTLREMFPDATTRAVVLTAPAELIVQRHTEREPGWVPECGWESYVKSEASFIAKAMGPFEQVDRVTCDTAYELCR